MSAGSIETEAVVKALKGATMDTCRGKRTFRDDTPAGMLRLTSYQVSPAGVSIAAYEPAGEIPKAGPNLPPPHPREVERQKRIAANAW